MTKIRRQGSRLLAVTALALLASCGGGGGGSTNPGGGGATTGSMRLVNSSTSTITQLLISPASAATWGANQLTSSIVPSGTFTVSSIPVGTYDFKAVASDGVTFWQANSISITAGGLYTWTVTPGAPTTGSLYVVNSTSFTISQLFVSPASAATWGANQLTSAIAAGGNFTLINIPVGTYDFKAVASDGATLWQTNSVSISAGGTSTWTLLPPAPTVGSLYVVNSTSYTITQLFVSPASAATWGADQLPSTIGPGGNFTLVNIPAGTYDFKAVASDGVTFWLTSSVTITAGGTSTWTLLPPVVQTGSLKINNYHCNPVSQLYVSPASSGLWGINQLTSSIASLGVFTLGSIPTGFYDVKAVGGDGIIWTSYGISITASGTFTWSLYMPSGTACLKVANTTAQTMGWLYTPLSTLGCSSGIWGSDQLAASTIPAYTNFTLSNVGAGYRDLRAWNLASTLYWQTCSAYLGAGTTYTWTLY